MLGPLESLVSTKRPGTRKAGEALISDDEQGGGEPEQVLASGHLVFLPAAAQGTRGGAWGRVCRPSPSIRLDLPGWGRARRCLFSWMCVKAFRPPEPCRTSHSRVSGRMRALLCCSGFLPAVRDSSFHPGRAGIRYPACESPGPQGWPVPALSSGGEGTSPEMAQSSFVFCCLRGQAERSRSLETDRPMVQPQFCCLLMMTQQRIELPSVSCFLI